ncbi:serine/threonine-protein kinase [Pengzhenrongella frigida]|uniref:non-specific serine/threonine protein kinase n=1 Tax=Pengzhenrongella frigida TaxID=1259133 RepID=A0A4Q5N198_9MICO|nr:serine/threonine-protein kinase [Cellulomonas sp. HLT2-17]RYV51835.1 serine/threonine protein kinase [Cellulomonas sp. HLT2-17]
MKPVQGLALGERYRLERQIAVGGMGEVWAGHDLSLARDVAVKVLRDEFAGDAGFLERFRTEARNSASLSHPNIAALYDYGEQDGSAFLVIELVVGEPMSDLLDRQPVVPTARLLPILAQTARALHAAHAAGVVHRDVKPGNILLGPDGDVKITDFGVSRAVNQAPLTATGMVMGTAQYLSPEQAVGRPATSASDLYSLGIVAYEALVGHRPFTGPTAVDIAVAHVNTPVPPLPASIEPRLADLVMRLLSKEPADRPRSGGALARAFDELFAELPASGAPRRSQGSPQPSALPPVAAPPVIAPVTVPPTAVPPTAPGTPPSYPPRRELRDTGAVPARTSTTTGRRVGSMTWPFVALVLLILALLGAALADSLWGSDPGAASPAASASSPHPTTGTPAPAAIGGMISSAPVALTSGAHTTTAKDA